MVGDVLNKKEKLPIDRLILNADPLQTKGKQLFIKRKINLLAGCRAMLCFRVLMQGKIGYIPDINALAILH